MALVLVAGVFTVGEANGTLIDGDNPVDISDGEPHDIGYRSDADEHESPLLAVPQGAQVSTDGSETWQTGIVALSSVGPVNKLLTIQQVSPSSAESVSTFYGPAVNIAPSISGTLAVADNGDGTVTLSGPTAIDNVDVFGWQWRLDGGDWQDVADSATGTMPSVVAGSGLQAGVSYVVDVRAIDAAGNGSEVVSHTATVPTSPWWFDTFDDASRDTNLWNAGLDSGAYATESGGSLVLDTSAGASYRGCFVGKKPIKRTASGLLVIYASQHASYTSAFLRLFDADYSGSYTSGTFGLSQHAVLACTVKPTSGTDRNKAQMRYYDSGGTAHFWDASGNQWSTSTTTFLPNAAGQHLYYSGDEAKCEAEIDHDNARVRLKMTHVGNAYQTVTGWVAIADLRATTGDLFVTAEDNSTGSPIQYAKFNSVDYSAA